MHIYDKRKRKEKIGIQDWILFLKNQSSPLCHVSFESAVTGLKGPEFL